MTVKLYWKVPYQQTFDARITEIVEEGIVLDQTLFYPESGNQSSDKGIIKKNGEAFEIDKVILKEDKIFHHLSPKGKQNLKIGDEIKGKIDWQHRYSLMKAHSSQHIFSAILKNQFNTKTKKVKIRPDRVVMKLANGINFSELKQALHMVNEIFTLQKDKIEDKILSKEEANEYGERLRGKIPNKEKVRLIFTEDYDVTCCGGTHVERTDEIGPIFLYEFKKGKKIKYYLEKKGLEYISRYNVEFLKIGDMFRIPIDQVTERIEKRVDDMELLEKEKEFLATRVLELMARNPDLEKKGLKISVVPFSVEKDVLKEGFERFPENSVLIFQLENQVLKIMTNSDRINAAELLNTLFDKYGGKGGGSPRLAQGRINTLPEDILHEIEKLI
ncbi:MAG: alanine--tRNA ligase-related protein [Promethearchaeia archaeon]